MCSSTKEVFFFIAIIIASQALSVMLLLSIRSILSFLPSLRAVNNLIAALDGSLVEFMFSTSSIEEGSDIIEYNLSSLPTVLLRLMFNFFTLQLMVMPLMAEEEDSVRPLDDNFSDVIVTSQFVSPRCSMRTPWSWT